MVPAIGYVQVVIAVEGAPIRLTNQGTVRRTAITGVSPLPGAYSGLDLSNFEVHSKFLLQPDSSGCREAGCGVLERHPTILCQLRRKKRVADNSATPYLVLLAIHPPN